MEHSFQISIDDETFNRVVDINSAQKLIVPHDEKTMMRITGPSSFKRRNHYQMTQQVKQMQKSTQSTMDNQSSTQGLQQNIVINVIKKAPIYKYQNYNALNLTFTLYTILPNKHMLKILCFFATITRLYLTIYFLAVIGITTTGLQVSKLYFLIPWVITVIGTRFLYFILVMRVSLSSAQNSLERTLKNIWNRNNFRINQAFQFISFQKIKSCFYKAIIPSEFAFIYIPSENCKRSTIYAIINFIYMSIQFVYMYPFVIVYNIFILRTRSQYSIQFWKYTCVTLTLSLLWTTFFISFCSYLIYRGCKLKMKKIK